MIPCSSPAYLLSLGGDHSASSLFEKDQFLVSRELPDYANARFTVEFVEEMREVLGVGPVRGHSFLHEFLTLVCRSGWKLLPTHH